MQISKTKLDDVLLIEPTVIHDSRGYFFESYRQSLLDETLGYPVRFVQENQSKSSYNVFRGFHFQIGEHAQAKLVSVVKGSIFDIVVNLQDGSFEQFFLSADNKKQLFIPKNYAHGFIALAHETTVQYKCDNYYSKEHEMGVNIHDTYFNSLLVQHKDLIISEKDSKWEKLSNLIWPTH